MRKSLLLLMGLVVAGCLYAEDAAQSFGFHIGFAQPIYRLNAPTAMESNPATLGSNALNGLKVGVVYDESLFYGLGYSVGLNYTFAAGQSAWADYEYEPSGKKTLMPTIDYCTNYRYHQGEIFVDWQYKFEIAQRTFLILYTGPTVQLSSYKATDAFRNKDGSVANLTTTHYSYADTQDSYLNMLNVTWGVGAGLQFDRYFIRGGYDFGIFNPYKKNTFDALGITGDDRWTRGRLDQWQVKAGFYLWQYDK